VVKTGQVADVGERKARPRPGKLLLTSPSSTSAIPSAPPRGTCQDRPAHAARPMAQRRLPPPTRQLLTEIAVRELAVLRLVATGRTNAQIGAELYISLSTADVHLNSLMPELGELPAGSRLPPQLSGPGLLSPKDRAEESKHSLGSRMADRMMRASACPRIRNRSDRQSAETRY